MNDLDRCCVCGGDEAGDDEGMAGCPICLGCYCANCGGYNKDQQLFTCKNCENLTSVTDGKMRLVDAPLQYPDPLVW
jgi:hypothetical protein